MSSAGISLETMVCCMRLSDRQSLLRTKEVVMAKVQGVCEKIHWPMHDAFFVKDEFKSGTTGPKKTFTDFMANDPRVFASS